VEEWIGSQCSQNAVDHDGGSIVPAEEVDGDPGELPLGSRHAVRQTAMTWRPLYWPQTPQAVCASFGDLHWGHGCVATAVVFHCDRRARVLLRDIFRFGTATANSPDCRPPTAALRSWEHH
jgi:hypothetical protein